MLIQEIDENKKRYLHLLLLADEQEDMVDRYLERGTMYVLDDNGVKAECIVTDEGNGVLEIKNIATLPDYQKQGYARKLIDFLVIPQIFMRICFSKCQGFSINHPDIMVF